MGTLRCNFLHLQSSGRCQIIHPTDLVNRLKSKLRATSTNPKSDTKHYGIICGTKDCALLDCRCPTLWDHYHADDIPSQCTSHFRTVWNVYGRTAGMYFNLFKIHVRLNHTYNLSSYLTGNRVGAHSTDSPVNVG